MELLIEDLGGPEVCSSLTIISDQQKSLLQAVQDVVPGVAQRFCVRHLYANFRKKFPGKNLKKLMWREAIATHPQKWESEIRCIKEVNKDAFRHLLSIPPRFWSRSRFTTTAQCDTLTDNISEAFNSVLVNTRTKPIITMLEEIRLYMMKRWATNRSRATSFKSSICPKILSRLQKEGLQTKNWIPSWSAQRLFEVRHVSQSGEKFVVDIDQYSCLCRKWSINGIPCVHALAAMRFLNIYPDVMPSSTRQMTGRPKKKRRLEQWELKKSSTRVSKEGLLERCGICREVRHNRKNCPKRNQVQEEGQQPNSLPEGEADGE
ncbi:uncharacterized protein LOC124836806 [Vigna umbellata]|uniref:uncharacterized protein LOC124836806 n=1 Tax=Vigna umbellata TaxID=87088 RepID=UPI001F5F0BAB|nr:uncharacterized protein LOC124836806 [Vigna umbellata]